MRFLLQLQLSVCVFVLFTASSKQTVSAFRPPIQENKCHDDNGMSRHTYNPAREECCNGFVYSKRFDKPYECCGNDMFESSTGECCSGRWILNHVQTCCNGVAYDLQEGMTCCGHGDSLQIWMNIRTQTCCYDEQEDIFETRNGRGICCGIDQLYIQGAQMCCESGFLSTVHDIDHPQEAGQLSCCGLETYNNTIEQCCVYERQDIIQPWSEYIACCGSGSYDIRTELCCNGIPQPLIGGRTQCCEQRSYNEAMETCCDKELFPIGHGSCCGQQAYSPTTASCCMFNLNTSIPMIPEVQKCCGLDSYLINQHVCCDGQLHEKSPGNSCCGSQLYDTQTELCCSKDTILPKHSEFTECCSGSTYKTDTQTCCSGQVDDIIGGRCCQTADPNVLQPYDPKTETCCERRSYGQTYEGADQKHNCCGSKLFNNQTEICHYEDVFDKLNRHLDHDSVCLDRRSNNYQTYNSKTAACSGQGSLVPKQPGERNCGGRLYHSDSRICCGGYQYDRTDLDGEEHQCCGMSSDYFVPSRQTCFNNKVYDIPQDLVSVCGQFAYNSQTHFCFQNIVVRPIESYNLVPCVNPHLPSAWYDPRESKCDRGTGKILASDQTLCNGFVFDTPGVGLRFGKCCNGLIGYNPWMEFCCGGRVHNITEGLTCCGDVIHNEHYSDEICCKDHLWSTHGGKTVCTDDVAHRPDQGICGVDVINQQTEICCDGIVYPRHDTTSCCGKVSFNNSDSTKLCCDSTLHLNTNGGSCCGTQLVDPTNTTCKYLKDKAYSLQIPLAQTAFCSESSYDDSQHTCCLGILHKGQGLCCGYSLITDLSLETCCGGVVNKYDPLLMCCNEISYNSRHFVCCGDEALHVHHSSKACCNNVIYNVYDQNCDGGVVSQKGPVTRRPYRAVPLRLQAAVVPVCGNRTYDSRTSGCCSGQLYSIFTEKCENGSVVRTKCEVCHFKNKSRKHHLKRACKSDLILLVRITAKEVNTTNKIITLTAEDIAIVKNLQDLSHGSMQVMKVKVPKACQCNRVINSSGSGNYMIMTNSSVDDVLWLQPGDSLTRSKDADFGKLVRRMLRLCENEETVFP